MPIPTLCLDAYLRHFAERFRHDLSKPQYQHFVWLHAQFQSGVEPEAFFELL